MATLKISDLSVGDWVQDKNGIYAKVIGMENWSNGYFLNIELHGVNVGVTPLNSAHPIPITAEILEKNGFVKYSEREWGCNDDSPCHTFIHIDTPDEAMWFISFPTIFNLIWDHPIYNIHQLQHLIRLAGVDKEINL